MMTSQFEAKVDRAYYSGPRCFEVRRSSRFKEKVNYFARVRRTRLPSGLRWHGVGISHGPRECVIENALLLPKRALSAVTSVFETKMFG
jgi:hypothetical protein